MSKRRSSGRHRRQHTRRRYRSGTRRFSRVNRRTYSCILRPEYETEGVISAPAHKRCNSVYRGKRCEHFVDFLKQCAVLGEYRSGSIVLHVHITLTVSDCDAHFVFCKKLADIKGLLMSEI